VFKAELIGNVSLIRWDGEITTTDLADAEVVIGRHKRAAGRDRPMLAVGVMGQHVRMPSMAVARRS
jgi:hypothetical protein